MRIGNLPDRGDAKELNKWYWEIELLSCPRTMCRVFKPTLIIILVKWESFGEPWRFGGAEEKRIGGRKDFTFPWGIIIEIVK